MSETDPRLGLTVTHRRYVPYTHAHYGGNLVDGAYTLGLFGDVATEVAIRMDGDEGLLAGYSQVRFLAPVRAGDVLEATAEVVRIGRRSRELRCWAQVVARAEPERGPSAARVLDPPEHVVEAVATVVVPAASERSGHTPARSPRSSRSRPREFLQSLQFLTGSTGSCLPGGCAPGATGAAAPGADGPAPRRSSARPHHQTTDCSGRRPRPDVRPEG